MISDLIEYVPTTGGFYSRLRNLPKSDPVPLTSMATLGAVGEKKEPDIYA
jgi:hypothetical protein